MLHVKHMVIKLAFNWLYYHSETKLFKDGKFTNKSSSFAGINGPTDVLASEIACVYEDMHVLKPDWK